MTGSKTSRKDGGLPRWGINRDYWVSVGDEPFLDRRVLVVCPWFGVFLSEIYKPDRERDPHDHSRPFISWVLSGGYDELVYSDLNSVRARFHRRGSVHLMPSRKAHTITAVHGRLRTLVIAGKSRGTWSFWTAQGKVDWQAYNLHLGSSIPVAWSSRSRTVSC